MKRNGMIFILLMLILALSGCRSIYVSGSGEYDGVEGQGSLNIPTGK